MSTVVDTLGAYPLLAVALAVTLRAALAWQRELTWPEYRVVHSAKRVVFPVVQRYEPFGFAEFVNRKGGRDDAEYLLTHSGGVRAVVRELREGGASLHLINSLKRRPGDHGDPLSAAHVVWTHADGTQTEAYLFANADGSTDLYSHFETSVQDPEGHLSDGQTDGDPRGVVTGALS